VFSHIIIRGLQSYFFRRPALFPRHSEGGSEKLRYGSSDKAQILAKTLGSADKSELSAEYFDTYNRLKALSAGEIRLLIAEK
jgi:hypothetical protein